jgi:hypothetical protein
MTVKNKRYLSINDYFFCMNCVISRNDLSLWNSIMFLKFILPWPIENE